MLPVTILAKVFYLADIRLQLLIVAEISARALDAASLLLIAHKREPDDTADETDHQKSQDARTTPTNNQNYFFCGHSFSSQLWKYKGKIVDEWRIEEQAIEPIEYAAMAGQNFCRVLCAGAAF